MCLSFNPVLRILASPMKIMYWCANQLAEILQLDSSMVIRHCSRYSTDQDMIITKQKYPVLLTMNFFL